MPMLTIDTSRGWMPDLLPWELPEGGCTDVSGLIPKVEGWEPIGEETAHSATTLTGQFAINGLFATGGSAVYTWSPLAGIGSDITRALGAYHGSYSWSRTIYGDWTVLCNGYDVPQVQKTSGGLLTNLGGNPPIASVCFFYKGYLILANLKPGLSIGSTDTRVATSWFNYVISGTTYNKTAVAAGTALAAGTIPQDKWGIYRFQVDAAGTISCLAGAANFTTGYNTEDLAIAALPALTASNAAIGYVTVQTETGSTFVGGTDALKGGTTGNPANATAYYSDGYNDSKTLILSAFENIESFPLTLATGSDYQTLGDAKGAIVAIEPMPFGFSIFCSNSIYNAQYIGSPYTFAFAKKTEDYGVLGGSTAPISGGVFFWTYDDMFFWNGETAESIGYGVRNFILNRYYGSGFGAINDQQLFDSGVYNSAVDLVNNIVYWAYEPELTSVGGCTIIAYNWAVKKWSYIKGLSAAASNAVYGIALIGIDSGLLHRTCLTYIRGNVDAKSYYLGGDYISTAYVQTKEINREDNGSFLIRKVRPQISDPTGSTTITIYTRRNEIDSYTTNGPYTVSTADGWAYMLVSGQRAKFRVTMGTSTGSGVLMNKITVDLVNTGLI